MRYRPILKGKPAEFSAWSNAAPAVISSCEPLFEVTPSADQDKDLKLFLDRVVPASPTDLVSVDAGYLDQRSMVASTGDTVIAWLSRELAAKGKRYRPTVRIHDDAGVLANAGAASGQQGEGLILRVGGDAADPDPLALARDLPGFLMSVGLLPPDIHLLIDMWSIDTPRDLARATAVANTAVAWAGSVGPWASITVASGAFPASISDLARKQAHLLPRLDASLWNGLAAPPENEVDFGDFAVNHPALGASVPRGPLPSIRYTNDDQWRLEGAQAEPGKLRILQRGTRPCSPTSLGRRNLLMGRRRTRSVLDRRWQCGRCYAVAGVRYVTSSCRCG